MEMADEAGYFAALIPGKGVTDYVYRVEYPEGETEEIIDPYRFGPVITKKDTDLLRRALIMRLIKFWAHIAAASTA